MFSFVYLFVCVCVCSSKELILELIGPIVEGLGGGQSVLSRATTRRSRGRMKQMVEKVAFGQMHVFACSGPMHLKVVDFLGPFL